MNNVHKFLNKLIFNQQYLADLMDEPAPCISLGIMKERKKEVGFILLRPEEEIPEIVTHQGFQLGNGILGISEDECAIQLSFLFYDYGVYHGLVNPGNSVVKRTIELMIENNDYFFIVINPSQRAVTYRSELEQGNNLGIYDNLDIIKNAVTSNEMYETIYSIFKDDPTPPGKVIPWVCREDVYSDLTNDIKVICPTCK